MATHVLTGFGAKCESLGAYMECGGFGVEVGVGGSGLGLGVGRWSIVEVFAHCAEKS